MQQLTAKTMAETRWLKHFLVLVLYWQKSVSADDCLATTSRAHSSVYCIFDDNIGSLKTGFAVELYYPVISSSVETLLECWWENDKLTCTPGPGIEYNKNVTDELTIRGPPMMDKVGGKVRCQGSRSSPEQVESCILTFVETVDATSGDGDKHDDSSAALVLGVLSFIGVLLILIIFSILFCLYKFRPRVYKYIRRWEATNRGSEETGESGRPLISQHPSMGGRSAGGQTVTDLQLLITGPQGSGKSSLANTITGGDTFPVGHSTADIATTRKPAEAVVTLCGKKIKVVDTPYICDPNRYSEEEQRQQVAQWKEMTSPGPSAILLVHNGKGMFTTQHNDDYQKLKTLWGEEDFCRRLIVIFTFTDKRHALYPGKSLEEQLETTVPNLKRVLHDAGNCYIEVNNRASQEENGAVVKEILDGVERKGHSQTAASPDPQTNVSQAPTDTFCDKNSMVSGSEQRTDGTDGTTTATAVSMSAHPQDQGREQKDLLLELDIPDTSIQRQSPAPQKVVAATTTFTIAQPSTQPQSQRGDPGTTLTGAAQSGQDTDTDQPPQQHSQEAGDAAALTASSGSPEQTPLVPGSEDGSEHKDEKEGKSKKKAKKNGKTEEKSRSFGISIGKKK